jgi:alkyl hydroperoxide reductase subunit AhpC
MEPISLKELQNDFKAAQEKKLENSINYIKSHEKWMNDIEKKALEKNIPVDSMVIMEAKWLIRHRN